MPDLDQLVDTLAADVAAVTRAPGAPSVVLRADRRRRRTGAVAAVGALVVLAAGGGLVSQVLDDGDGRSSLAGPTAAPSSDAQAPEGSESWFQAELRRIFAQVPGWTVVDADPMVLQPCGGDWSSSAVGGSGGSVDLTAAGGGPDVWADGVGFPSAEEAAAALARLVQALTSCTAERWRAEPLTGTGTVVASSATGVVWMSQDGARVATLQVPTADGPPPLAVQIEVAEVLRASLKQQPTGIGEPPSR